MATQKTLDDAFYAGLTDGLTTCAARRRPYSELKRIFKAQTGNLPEPPSLFDDGPSVHVLDPVGGR